MAAMKIPKQSRTQRRGIDPPANANTAPASHSPPVRVRDPLPSTQAAILPIFPIPHKEADRSFHKDGKIEPPSSKYHPSTSSDAPIDASWISTSVMTSTRTASTRSLSSHHRTIDHAPSTSLRSSMQKSTGVKSKKTVRYDTVNIYEHDLERPLDECQTQMKLDEYEATRGPRRSPKFFLKSDEELKTVRKMKQDQEERAEKEWREIRQEAMSIQEEASVMSATPSVRSTKSEASFANASFYEGFEERFRVKKKKSPNMISRFGRFLRRRSDNSSRRKSKSMIGDM